MKLRDHLEKQQEKLTDITVAITGIQKDIRYHVKRTNLLEEKVNILKRQVEPLKKDHHVRKTLWKGLASILGVAVAGATIYKIFFM